MRTRWNSTAGLVAAVCSSVAWAQAPSTLDDELGAFVAQYLDGNGIEYHATVAVHLYAEFGDEYADDGAPIWGSFDAWARDGRYRQSMSLDPVRFPGLDKDIAFDGNIAQEWSVDQDLIATKAGDAASYGMALPDPLAEMIQFLYPISDDEPLDPPRFTTPFVDPGLSDRLAAVQWITWDTESAIAQFPGAAMEGEVYTYRVAFDRIGGTMVPRLIERRVGSQVRTALILSDVTQIQWAGGTNLWPTTIVYQTYAPDTTLLGEYRYTITSIDQSGSFDDSIFVIQAQGIGRVWDVDAQQFVP